MMRHLLKLVWRRKRASALIMVEIFLSFLVVFIVATLGLYFAGNYRRPLGYDWQIGIGIVSSFAAREVIVSTLAIVYGVGDDVAEKDNNSLYDSLRRAKRSDGTAIFNTATCASLLVFYILAAQCLSTTAVVKRETNTWRYPLLMAGYLFALAYLASFIAYRSALWLLGP